MRGTGRGVACDGPDAAGARQGAASVSQGDDAAGQGVMIVGRRVSARAGAECCVLVAWGPFVASTAETQGADSDAEMQVLTYVDMTWRDVANTLGVLLKSLIVEANVALRAVKDLFFAGKWFVAQSSSRGSIEAKAKRE